MKTKILSVSIATSLLINPLAALAQDAAQPVPAPLAAPSSSSEMFDYSKLTPAQQQAMRAQLMKMAPAAMADTIESMRKTRAHVEMVIHQIQQWENMNESDPFLKHLKKIQAASLMINGAALKLETKSKLATTAVVTATFVSALTNTIIRHYDPTSPRRFWKLTLGYREGQTNKESINQLVQEALTEVKKMEGVDSSIQEVSAALQNSLKMVKDNESAVESELQKYGLTQDAAFGLAVLNVVTHLFPHAKLTQFIDKTSGPAVDLAKRYISKKAGIPTAAATTKGTTFISGFPDLIGAFASWDTEDIKVLLVKTSRDLITTRSKIEAAIADKQ